MFTTCQYSSAGGSTAVARWEHPAEELDQVAPGEGIKTLSVQKGETTCVLTVTDADLASLIELLLTLRWAGSGCWLWSQQHPEGPHEPLELVESERARLKLAKGAAGWGLDHADLLRTLLAGRRGGVQSAGP